MAVTKIADVIVPEVFNPYVVQRTAELSELYQSGILDANAEFDRLASSPSHVVHLPFWNDLTGEDEVLRDDAALIPGKITTEQDIAVILRRGRAWGVNDLAAALAGDDPMRAIGDLVADYWRRRIQAALIATLKGVFASPTMETNLHDISAATGDAAYFTGETFIDALQKLGDAKEYLTAIVMHSAVEASLAKQNLIMTLQPSENMPEFKTYMGKRVIVDDGVPVETAPTTDEKIFYTYIFAEKAVAYGNGNPVGFVATETDRDTLAGEDYLITRKTFIIHPRGVRYKGTVVNPNNTELAKGDNWERVYEPKNIRIVCFKHKIK